MRPHDERPGSAGGYPDNPYYSDAQTRAGVPRPGSAAASSSAETRVTTGWSPHQQTGSAQDLDYYDNGYSDDAAALGGLYADDYYDESGDGRKRFGWNGGTDLGLFILRLALGGLFIVHGAQKLFGVFGGPGPEGFAEALETMGFARPAVLALVTGATELGAGALLILGLFTPLAAAGVLGVMISAITVKFDAGLFATTGGFEYEAMLGAAALALLFTGPGRAALDYGRSWFRRPVISGFIGLVIAVGAAVPILLLLR